MAKVFGMSHLPTSSLSTPTPSSLTFPHGLRCSHTEVLTSSQTDDFLSHLWPPLHGQPHARPLMWPTSIIFQDSCGYHFLQEVFPIPNTGWGLFFGPLQLPVLTDTTTPFTLKCSCLYAPPECKLPEDRTRELSAAECSRSWRWQVLN